MKWTCCNIVDHTILLHCATGKTIKWTSSITYIWAVLFVKYFIIHITVKYKVLQVDGMWDVDAGWGMSDADAVFESTKSYYYQIFIIFDSIW